MTYRVLNGGLRTRLRQGILCKPMPLRRRLKHPLQIPRLLRHLPSHHLPHRALSRLNPGSTLQTTLPILHPPRPHPSQQLPILPHLRLRPGSTPYCLTAKSSSALPASPQSPPSAAPSAMKASRAISTRALYWGTMLLRGGG